MMSSFKEVIKSFLIKKIFPQLSVRLPLSGHFSTYEEALRHCSGYDNIVIFDKVKNAIQGLLEGRGTYERDGFLFNSSPEGLQISKLLAGLIKSGDYIVDFGGGLGGTYLNSKDILPLDIHYNVIEQQRFVELGIKMFAHYHLPLYFSSDFSQCPDSVKIIILSGVLQYIPNPYEVLELISKLQPEFILIDRTAFGSDKFWRLQLNRGVYSVPIEYPHRCIAKMNVFKLLDKYKLVETWTNSFDPIYPQHSGLLFHYIK